MTFTNKNSIGNHDFFIFELLVIELCNMNCSYCYMRNDSPSWGKFSLKKDVFKVIYQLEELSKYQKVSICLSGGEASLHPNYMEFIEYISNTNMDLHINTNLQLSQEKIKKILKINEDVFFHISWHSEADNDFTTKILSIPQRNQELNVMIHPAKKHEMILDKFIEEIKGKIKFNLKPIFVNDNFKPSEYVLSKLYHKDQNAEYIDHNKIEYTDFKLYSEDLLPMDTYGWDCYYIFYTIDCRQGNIKQMCPLFDDLNIFKDYDFFKDYDLNSPVRCPFKSKCLWASSLDHYKESNEEQRESKN